jgi:hypothetical protein
MNVSSNRHHPKTSRSLHGIVIARGRYERLARGIFELLVRSPRHRNRKETAMFAKTTKVVVTALVLAGTSLAFVANASAAAGQPGWSQSSDSYMKDRHDPTNTNGF